MSDIYDSSPAWVDYTFIAYQIRDAETKDIKVFVRALFDSMDDDERKWWFNLFAREAYPEKRWHKVRRWMEQRYEKNYDWTPRRMAATYLNYSRMDSRMMPLLIKIARQVKNMIRMRRKREEAKTMKEDLEGEVRFDD